jgi:major membrane immunogen (membrane-anchored lipoprotein)
MKLNSIIKSILVFLVIISCSGAESSLDQVKAFQPDDKYFKAALVSLHFQIETSDIPTADKAFQKVVEHYSIPVDASGCANGIYKGASPPDAYDYEHVVMLEIKDEKIVSVDYNEVHTNGIGKQEDIEYCEEMSVMGTDPSRAYPFMENELLEKQQMMEVDGMSGATYSRYRFRYAVMVALMKARLAIQK